MTLEGRPPQRPDLYDVPHMKEFFLGPYELEVAYALQDRIKGGIFKDKDPSVRALGTYRTLYNGETGCSEKRLNKLHRYAGTTFHKTNWIDTYPPAADWTAAQMAAFGTSLDLAPLDPEQLPESQARISDLLTLSRVSPRDEQIRRERFLSIDPTDDPDGWSIDAARERKRYVQEPVTDRDRATYRQVKLFAALSTAHNFRVLTAGARAWTPEEEKEMVQTLVDLVDEPMHASPASRARLRGLDTALYLVLTANRISFDVAGIRLDHSQPLG